MRARLLVLLAALAAPAAAGAPPPLVHVGLIDWPGPDGRRLHGMMAIPAKARGRRQPAVVILGRGTMPQGFAWHAAERIAADGLIACALDAPASAALADGGATVRWLVGNRYIAGKIGLIGIGDTTAEARRLVADQSDAIAALALVDEAAPAAALPAAPPTIAVASLTSGDPLAARDDALDRAALFLKEHLP